MKNLLIIALKKMVTCGYLKKSNRILVRVYMSCLFGGGRCVSNGLAILNCLTIGHNLCLPGHTF